MSIAKLFTILTILTLLVWAGCSSESTTAPENGDPVTGSSAGLTIVYATDAAAAVTDDITSGSGGTLETTATDGVVYKLVVPPNAVSSPVTATMTPLASLTITDAGTSGGSAPAAVPASSECHRGVVLEPSGVEFDPPAVLTMTFPGGGSGCDLETDYRVVYFESSWNTYEILSTTLDDGANKLTCDITHFSVFGTDNPTSDRLQNLIEAATAGGLADPDEEALKILASYLEEAGARNWDDLAALARSGLHDVLDKLADKEISESNVDPSEDAFDELFDLLGWAFDYNFGDIDAKLRQGIEAVVRGVASEGHRECSQGNKEQGSALLILAFDWIGDGWVDDPAFEEDVDDWLAYCGELSMTLTANREYITDIALDRNSTATFADFEATVYSYGGEPLEGLSVGLEMVRADGQGGSPRTVDTGYSDASGKVRFRYAYGRSPQANTTLKGKYVFFVGREGRRLAEVEVQLIRVPIGVSFDYGFSYDIEVPNVMYRHISASLELGGTRTTQVQDCYWNRAYSFNAWDGYKTTEAVLLPTDYTGCIYDIKTVTYVRDDEYRTAVAVLSGVEVSLRGPGLGRIKTTITYPDGTEITESDGDLRGAFGTAYPTGDSVTLDYFDGTGMFDDFGFSGNTADGNGSGGCTITAWVLPFWLPSD